MVTDERAEFTEAGVERLAIEFHGDVPGERFEIGEDDAGADVRLEAEDGIADVIEMGRDGLVEEQRVLELGGIADGAVVADEDVFPDVGVVADLAIAPDDGRAFDHRAVLHDRAFPDENIFADVGDALAFIVQARLEMALDVLLDPGERVPGMGAAIKERGVLGLAQVKQIGGFEHGGKLGESWRGGNVFLTRCHWNSGHRGGGRQLRFEARQ